MFLNALSPLAFLALAGHAIAEPVPQHYQLNVAKMSVRDIFGLQRRDDGGEYQPSDTQCGSGTTCAEACGAGFEQCGSKDDEIHCFNPKAGQTCCSGAANGNACDAGYFCANDGKGATWCCKDGDKACGGKIPISSVSSTSVAAATTNSPSPSPTTISTTLATPAAPTAVASSSTASISSSSSFSSPSGSPSSPPSSSLVSPTGSIGSSVVTAESTSIAAVVTSQSVPATCTTYTTEVVVPISAPGSASITDLITSATKSYVSQTASASATSSNIPVTASSSNQHPMIALVIGAAALAALAL
ncbi:hypothetical protein PG996_009687 [Apiospora saccharicola]|uniref:Uncharacterized protein n=1 Tax=Apiospora saccharicola TaxID=335842 RepID=A0ABR1ULH6_9PEZI